MAIFNQIWPSLKPYFKKFLFLRESLLIFTQKVILLPRAIIFICGGVLYVILTTLVVILGFPLILLLILMEKIERRILKTNAELEKNSQALINALRSRLGISEEEEPQQDIPMEVCEKFYSCQICFTPFDGKKHRQCALTGCG